MPERIVMLVDLDYFYAQAEENRNPDLRGRPVVVGMYSGRTERSGAVATCNYEAREHGVHAGMVLSRAYKALEDTDAEFVEADFNLYERVSENIMNILREYATRFEQVSIDEAYLEVSDRCAGYGDAEELAREIKDEVLDSEDITCSVGIGPNKLVAKMASDLEKPDGLSIVTADEFLEVFGDESPKELHGIGPKTRDKLEEMRITTIRELAEADMHALHERFGEKMGTYFHEAAHGSDNEPVEESEPKQFGRIVTLKENTRALEEFEDTITKLSNEVVEAASERGYQFRTVGLFAVFEDLDSVTRSHTLNEYHEDAELLASEVRKLYEQLLAETDMDLRRVGVRVSNLRRKGSGLERFFPTE